MNYDLKYHEEMFVSTLSRVLAEVYGYIFRMFKKQHKEEVLDHLECQC